MVKQQDDKKRVVVTGLGVVSSLGIGCREFWRNIMAGRNGITKIAAFDTSKFERHYAGEIKLFNPNRYFTKKQLEHLGRTSQLAIVASRLALKDARLKLQSISKKEVGVCVGTTMGEAQFLEKDRYKRMKRNVAMGFPASNIAANISKEFKLKGSSIVFSSACAAGNYAVGRAYDLIKAGKLKYAIAGGSDGLSRIAFAGFSRMLAMSEKKCTPFDSNRKGMMLGEGSGILFLETLDSARKRKARIYAEILGYGLSCDAAHMTNPRISGVCQSVKKALKDARLEASEVDYICAHGTGTPENDKVECKAFRKLFGDFLDNIPLSSIKSMIGHTMGAAAAIESVACCLAVKNNKVPPTINVKKQDPECNIDCVPHKGRKHIVNVALNNSQAFGGNNCCVVFKS